MYKDMIITMVIALSVVMPATAIFIGILDKKDKEKQNVGAALMKKNKKSLLYKTYRFLSRFPLTRSYMDKLTRRYDVLCPGDAKAIGIKSVTTFLLSMAISIIASIVLFFHRPTLQGGILAVIFVFVINNEVVTRQVRSTEIKLLKQMASFISDVRHNYYIHRMVDDAIELSLDSCGKYMKPHAKKLLEVVSSNSLKEDVAKYNAATNNKYLKMFIALCISVIEDKDQTMNGQILFTANLEHLKKEINIEVLKLEKLRYLFSGIVFVTMSVCIPVGWIRNFAVDIMPRLNVFYDGRAGMLYVFLTYTVAVLIYILTNNLRETKKIIQNDYKILKRIEKMPIIKQALDNYTEKKYGKMKMLGDTLKRIGETMSPKLFLLKRMLTSGIIFVVCILLTLFMHSSIRNHALNDTGEASQLENIGYIQNTDTIDRLIVDYVHNYKDKEFVPDKTIKTVQENNAATNQEPVSDSDVSSGDFIENMDEASETMTSTVENFQNPGNTEDTLSESMDKNLIGYSGEVETLAKELIETGSINKRDLAYEVAAVIIQRILRYQNEYFKWYELIVCMAVAFIGFYAPYWMVLYKKKVLQMNMEDEVNQFNSIIYMLMYIEHMTVKDILEELEIFASVFKQSLRDCINEYNSGDIKALEHLKEKETYEPFRRMVDNFIRCDIIPIDKAFDEISSDRENYHDRRKQENEIAVQKRADIAKPLSFVPAVMVAIYLMGPLMWASLQELAGFSQSMNMLG